MSRGRKEAITGVNRQIHLHLTALHLKYYLRLNASVLSHGVPLRELLALKHPFAMHDLPRPPLLSIDITDACDLNCVYCNNPLFPHPRTMMSREVLQSILRRLEQCPVNRIRIGGGEPTLHPDFLGIMRELSTRTKFLSVVSNGQWKDPDFGGEIMATGIDLIEISMDAGGAEIYEKSRRNASYSRLLDNLAALKQGRDWHKSHALIRIRLMLRPSTRHLEEADTRFLSRFADCVFPQLLVKHPESDYDEDVLIQHHIERDSIPVCTVPFKDLQVRPDGRVPVCPAKGCSLTESERLFLGNLADDSIPGLWNSKIMTEIRHAQRTRTGDILQMCRGCHYG